MENIPKNKRLVSIYGARHDVAEQYRSKVIVDISQDSL